MRFTFLTTSASMLLFMTICCSCIQTSELDYKPFVMATAATYTESGQGSPLLRFTIVYWADDVSGLKVNIYNPDGDLAITWEQPTGLLNSGTPVKIDGLAKKTGGWRLTFSGTVNTNNDHYGESFEDEAIVTVNE